MQACADDDETMEQSLQWLELIQMASNFPIQWAVSMKDTQKDV